MKRLAICPACQWLVRLTKDNRIAEHTILHPFIGGDWERVCAGSGLHVQ